MRALRIGTAVTCFWLLLLGLAGAAVLAVGAEPLGALLGGQTGAVFTDHDDGSLAVTAPPGTAVLALASGTVRTAADGTVTVAATGDESGLVITYRGIAVPVATTVVTGGSAVGAVAASGRFDVSATVDGVPVDIGPRLTDGAQDPTATGPLDMRRPVDGATISQGFGCTDFAAEPADARCPGGHVHSGIDLAAALGTPVVAALAGRVHVVRTIGGYGLRVELTHAGGLLTLYGHLRSAAVADGDTVLAGEAIGTVGSTGNSTGPHLHFEVRRAGVPEDPRIDVHLP